MRASLCAVAAIGAGKKTDTIEIKTVADKVLLAPGETLMVTLTEVTTSAGSVTVGTPKTATTTIEAPVVDSINRVNTSVLPGVARAMSASTLGGVSGRPVRRAARLSTPLTLVGREQRF